MPQPLKNGLPVSKIQAATPFRIFYSKLTPYKLAAR
jgi:hypothetical protein